MNNTVSPIKNYITQVKFFANYVMKIFTDVSEVPKTNSWNSHPPPIVGYIDYARKLRRSALNNFPKFQG